MHKGVAPTVLVLLASATVGVLTSRNRGPDAAASVTRQPQLLARKARILESDGLTFKDLNKNGRLDVYEDWRQPVPARVADLVSQMSLAEKAGLMLHASLAGFMGPIGEVLSAPGWGPPGFVPPHRADVTPLDRPSPAELILVRNARWILVRPAPREAPGDAARFANGLQEMAEGSRLGIPIALSSDPRHSPRQVPAGVPASPPLVSQWPEPIGFAAIADPATVLEFGRIAAQEYRALGLRVTLSPMADIATEPRWNRIGGTFGEDPRLVAQLVKAYVEGFQGRRLGSESVLTVTKHWPGDGPVKDGQDPHNDYGKWQVYPGKQFEQHLMPFEAAFEAGTGGIMGGYAIPVGFDTVGINFSKAMIGELLRKQRGYDGVVMTDWVRDMPWGVERLTEKERQQLVVEAGVDQLGGDNDPRYLMELVGEGRVAASRIDESAARILRPMFQLGLFENPYVDPERAVAVVASEEFVKAGETAQRRSIVLLKNAMKLLPLAAKPRLYVENFSRETAARYGTLVEDPKQAAVALIKVDAPYALHKGEGVTFFRGSHEGTLAYAGAENAKELDAIKRLASTGTPTVVFMHMDRPAVLSELIDDVAAVLVHWSSSDDALLDVVCGGSRPGGKLPFDLPRDMASVLLQKEDVPRDLRDPLFPFGFGLEYPPSDAKAANGGIR